MVVHKEKSVGRDKKLVILAIFLVVFLGINLYLFWLLQGRLISDFIKDSKKIGPYNAFLKTQNVALDIEEVEEMGEEPSAGFIISGKVTKVDSESESISISLFSSPSSHWEGNHSVKVNCPYEGTILVTSSSEKDEPTVTGTLEGETLFDHVQVGDDITTICIDWAEDECRAIGEACVLKRGVSKVLGIEK